MYQQLNRFFIQTIQYLYFFIPLILIALPKNTVAEDYGRYRAIIMQEEGRKGIGQATNSFPKVFVIDSKDGHMWTWEEKKRIQGIKKNFTLGTVLTYQGRVTPGDKIGDIVGQSVRE